MKNYRQTVLVQSTPENAFAALTQQIGKWWGRIDCPPSEPNDVFTVSFGDASWVFRISALHKFSRVSWECIDAVGGFEEEWIGTILHWEIFPGEGTFIEIKVEHEGLVPDLSCYEICSSTWDYYIKERLKEHMEKVPESANRLE